MTKKIAILLVSFAFVFQPVLKAGEGMWLPFLIDRLNYEDMKEKGLQLTPEEIYSVNNSSIKDAIVVFGGGCTGEIVSDQGLLLTNHHCGYSYIQEHSTVENDYLTEGFWAESFEEELPNPGLQVKFLVRIEDVTDKVQAELNDDMSESERNQAIRKVSMGIEKKAAKDTYYDASVRSFFKGNEFYLFVYKTYKDVRLVGTPPSSIGKFGGDTDNWMWPRQTGDFSVFRVYADKDGKPAEYSEDNVPLEPDYHLPISLDGVDKGDFSMIMGYPGGTQRYLTSHGVKQAINKRNPTIVNIRDKKLDIMKKAMDASKEIEIQYASKYARTANYYKYFKGQTKGLKNLNVIEKKRKIEEDFKNWVNKSDAHEEKYGNALENIKNGYQIRENSIIPNIYVSEAIFRGSDILPFAYRNFTSLYKALKADSSDKFIEQKAGSIKKRLDDHFKNYNASLDMKLLGAMLEAYYQNVPKFQHPELLQEYYDKFDGNFRQAASYIFSKSSFDSKKEVLDLLEKPKERKIRKDKAYELVNAFRDKYSQIRKDTRKADDLLAKGYRKFVAGLREMNPDKKYYPNANFTMRVTYGTVQGYSPEDAVDYLYYTTLEGVMEKEDPDNKEFIVPDKLKELYENKNYGRYGEDGTMRVCFLNNLDITGGNSGSPVIDGKGRLVGIAFDGNWEAMSGDIAFEPELQRTISVDIRYVLFIIDKFAGAKRLIEEMDIVQNAGSEKEKADLIKN